MVFGELTLALPLELVPPTAVIELWLEVDEEEDDDVEGFKIPLTSGGTGTEIDAETQRRPEHVVAAGDEEEEGDTMAMEDDDEVDICEMEDVVLVVLLEATDEEVEGLDTPLRSDETGSEAEPETGTQGGPGQDADVAASELVLGPAGLVVIAVDDVNGLSTLLTMDTDSVAETDAERQSSPEQDVEAVVVILALVSELEPELELVGFVVIVGEEDVSGLRTPLTTEETGSVAETDAETQRTPEQDVEAEENKSRPLVVVGEEVKGLKAPFTMEESDKLALPEAEIYSSPVQDDVVATDAVASPASVTAPVLDVPELCVPGSEDAEEEVGSIAGSEAEKVTQAKPLQETDALLLVL